MSIALVSRRSAYLQTPRPGQLARLAISLCIAVLGLAACVVPSPSTPRAPAAGISVSPEGVFTLYLPPCIGDSPVVSATVEIRNTEPKRTIVWRGSEPLDPSAGSFVLDSSAWTAIEGSYSVDQLLILEISTKDGWGYGAEWNEYNSDVPIPSGSLDTEDGVMTIQDFMNAPCPAE